MVDRLVPQVAPRSVGVYAVNYSAGLNFLTTADAANDAAGHIAWLDQCPDTRVVLRRVLCKVRRRCRCWRAYRRSVTASARSVRLPHAALAAPTEVAAVRGVRQSQQQIRHAAVEHWAIRRAGPSICAARRSDLRRGGRVRAAHSAVRASAVSRSGRRLHRRTALAEPTYHGAMSRALVIGEALIDVVESDGRISGEYVGGSPLNVAVGLTDWAAASTFLTTSPMTTAASASSSTWSVLGYSWFRVAPAPAGPRPPSPPWTPPDRPTIRFDIDWRLTGTPEVATRCWSTRLHRHRAGTGVEVPPPRCVDAYRMSATISFDPNVRPGVIQDDDIARGRVDRLIERADIVEASEDDLRWLDPRRLEQIARAWLEVGPSIVAVTSGVSAARSRCAGPDRCRFRPGRSRWWTCRRGRRRRHDGPARRVVVAGTARRRPPS